MRTQFYVKLKKSLLMVLRKMTRPMANRWRLAAVVYYRCDFALYELKNIYVLPVIFYRLMTWLCNFIAAVNTVDHRTLHSRRLQIAVDWMIHRIPDEIRFA